MNILINDKRKIQAIQEDFHEMFPYLKIEFFSKSHLAGMPSSKSTLFLSSRTLGQCREVHRKGKLTISADMTVADLEQRFSDLYGLSVQVFRKSGTVWLETTVTDNWTLEEQNRQGEELSRNHKFENITAE